MCVLMYIHLCIRQLWDQSVLEFFCPVSFYRNLLKIRKNDLNAGRKILNQVDAGIREEEKK